MGTHNSRAPVPFLFTNEKELDKNGKWFAMWINPKSLSLKFAPRQTEVTTKKGYGYLHWRNRPIRVTFQGVSGWLYGEQIKTAAETTTQNALQQYSDQFNLGSRTTSGQKETVSKLKNLGSQLLGGSADDIIDVEKGIESPQSLNSNSAYLFVKRLQRIALQEKLFTDTQGFRRNNTCRLKIFTKRYPQGIILEGFFNSFTVPEKFDDPQYIAYKAVFTCLSGLEEEQPIVELDFMKLFPVDDYQQVPDSEKPQSGTRRLNSSGEGLIAENLSPNRVLIEYNGSNITAKFDIDYSTGAITPNSFAYGWVSPEERVLEKNILLDENAEGVVVPGLKQDSSGNVEDIILRDSSSINVTHRFDINPITGEITPNSNAYQEVSPPIDTKEKNILLDVNATGTIEPNLQPGEVAIFSKEINITSRFDINYTTGVITPNASAWVVVEPDVELREKSVLIDESGIGTIEANLQPDEVAIFTSTGQRVTHHFDINYTTGIITSNYQGGNNYFDKIVETQYNKYLGEVTNLLLYKLEIVNTQYNTYIGESTLTLLYTNETIEAQYKLEPATSPEYQLLYKDITIDVQYYTEES